MDKPFAQFNQARELLAQQFEDMIVVVANQVFPGHLDGQAINLLEEISLQENLSEPEKNVLKQIYFYANTLRTSKFLLGVLGRFKSGKSTLLDGLAGVDISPINTRISTGVLNFTYRADQEKCHVAYDNGHEIPISPAEKILYVDFQYNPDNEKGIHSVHHGSPHLDLQKEIVFVDTPGLEAVNQIHEKITLDFVSQCHAAVIVSTYPPFGLTELQFYQRVQASIPNVFLVQNLPKDKLSDWIGLEAQTLENLHKLAFYTLDQGRYGSKDVRSILREIAANEDEKRLEEFKEIHKIHLYSINAQAAYDAIILGMPLDSETRFAELQQSRFSHFKTALYDFLATHKGKILLNDYLEKGRVMLRELIFMVQHRQQLLQKSLTEIENEIVSIQEKQRQTTDMVNMLLDHATVQIMEAYRQMKADIMGHELQNFIQELNKEFGQLNVFRLKHPEIKNIKIKIGEFNRVLGQQYHSFLKKVYGLIQQTQEKIAQTLENHGMFSKLEITANVNQIELGQISGAGYIDYGFEIAFRGGIAYFFGSIAGGTGIALLGAGFLPALVGAAIGIGISIPLGKYCGSVLEFGKDLLGKIAHRPASTIFDKFRNDVRERLDELEIRVLEPSIQSLKVQVLQNTNDYFTLFRQRLQELRNRKAHGMSQQMCEQECQKLQRVVQELQHTMQQFSKKEEEDSTEIPSRVQTLFRGIKSYLKKFRKSL